MSLLCIEYTLTIPYFKCTYDQEKCKTACGPANQKCTDGCDMHCAANVTTTAGVQPPTASSSKPTASSTSTYVSFSGANEPFMISIQHYIITTVLLIVIFQIFSNL